MQEAFDYGPCLSDGLACDRHKANLVVMIPEMGNRVYAPKAHENFKPLLY